MDSPQQAFAPSYWAFSFGVATLPTMAIRMLERGAEGPVQWLATGLFIAANVIIGLLIVGTVRKVIEGKLLPAPVAQVKQA